MQQCDKTKIWKRRHTTSHACNNISREKKTTHANIKVSKWMFFVRTRPQRVLSKVNLGARCLEGAIGRQCKHDCAGLTAHKWPGVVSKTSHKNGTIPMLALCAPNSDNCRLVTSRVRLLVWSFVCETALNSTHTHYSLAYYFASTLTPRQLWFILWAFLL